MNLIEKKQIEALLKSFQIRKPDSLNSQLIEKIMQKISNNAKSFEQNKKELYDILSNNGNFEQYLQETSVTPIDKEQETKEIEVKIKTSLNLSNIREFTIGEKNYIQIYYEDGTTKILENLNNLNTKEIFEYAKEKLDNANIDGKENAKEIFETLMKQYIEIPLESKTKIDTDELKKEDEVEFNLVKSRFPNNEIMLNAEEKIYIVMGLNGEPNRGYTVESQNNELVLIPLNEKTYGVVEENGIEDSENDLLENETIDSLKEQITIEAVGLSEDAVIEELSERLARANTKKELYATLQWLYMVKKKGEATLDEQTKEYVKPKTLVLKKDLNPNAFVDVLILTFITGLCGGIFLTILFNLI